MVLIILSVRIELSLSFATFPSLSKRVLLEEPSGLPQGRSRELRRRCRQSPLFWLGGVVRWWRSGCKLVVTWMESLRTLMIGLIWSTKRRTGSEPRPNLCLSLTHWDSWLDNSTTVRPVLYRLNSPLLVINIPVLLKWDREDYHRENFLQKMAKICLEAISVDILCSWTIRISVLGGSLSLLIDF